MNEKILRQWFLNIFCFLNSQTNKRTIGSSIVFILFRYYYHRNFTGSFQEINGHFSEVKAKILFRTVTFIDIFCKGLIVLSQKAESRASQDSENRDTLLILGTQFKLLCIILTVAVVWRLCKLRKMWNYCYCNNYINILRSVQIHSFYFPFSNIFYRMGNANKHKLWNKCTTMYQIDFRVQFCNACATEVLKGALFRKL